MVSIWSIIVLVATRRVANAAAEAARDQAEAAKAQVVSADAAAELAREQLQAARDQADAERQHSHLIKLQMQATLRPVLVFSIPTESMMLRLDVENQSATAIASSLIVEGLEPNKDLTMTAASTMLGPGGKTHILGLSGIGKQGSLVRIYYDSDDGRQFVTEAKIDQKLTIRQRAWWTGGHSNDPA